MKNKKLLEKIIVDEKVMVGKPIIKGTRLTVHFILNLLANGSNIQDIIEEYNGLTKDDILACLYYAANTIDNTTFMPLTEAS